MAKDYVGVWKSEALLLWKKEVGKLLIQANLRCLPLWILTCLPRDPPGAPSPALRRAAHKKEGPRQGVKHGAMPIQPFHNSAGHSPSLAEKLEARRISHQEAGLPSSSGWMGPPIPVNPANTAFTLAATPGVVPAFILDDDSDLAEDGASDKNGESYEGDWASTSAARTGMKPLIRGHACRGNQHGGDPWQSLLRCKCNLCHCCDPSRCCDPLWFRWDLRYWVLQCTSATAIEIRCLVVRTGLTLFADNGCAIGMAWVIGADLQILWIIRTSEGADPLSPRPPQSS